MSHEHEFEEFYRLACEEFGEDKFTIKPIQISEEDLEKFNKQSNSHVTLEDLQKVKEVWLMKDECPRCNDGVNLGFYFEWGMIHGYGYCIHCKTRFKYYHYFGDSKIPVRAYSLAGF